MMTPCTSCLLMAIIIAAFIITSEAFVIIPQPLQPFQWKYGDSRGAMSAESSDNALVSINTNTHALTLMHTYKHTYMHTLIYIHTYIHTNKHTYNIHSYAQVHVEVKISVDDVPFLFHDDILDRTTNAKVNHISTSIAL